LTRAIEGVTSLLVAVQDAGLFAVDFDALNPRKAKLLLDKVHENPGFLSFSIVRGDA
jgi:hypothetical protein